MTAPLEHLVDEPLGSDVFHTELQLGYEQLPRASRMEALSDAVVHKRDEARGDDYTVETRQFLAPLVIHIRDLLCDILLTEDHCLVGNPHRAWMYPAALGPLLFHLRRTEWRRNNVRKYMIGTGFYEVKGCSLIMTVLGGDAFPDILNSPIFKLVTLEAGSAGSLYGDLSIVGVFKFDRVGLEFLMLKRAIGRSRSALLTNLCGRAHRAMCGTIARIVPCESC